MNRFDGHKVDDWKPLLGHRCIVVGSQSYAGGGYEVVVTEVSPQGRPKLRFITGSGSWENKDEYLLIEDLGETDVLFQKNV